MIIHRTDIDYKILNNIVKVNCLKIDHNIILSVRCYTLFKCQSLDITNSINREGSLIWHNQAV